jgi:hypothetical protein
MENIEYKGYNIKISQDECLDSPREWDNLGKMVCFHGRYELGDKTDLKSDNFDGWQELKDYLIKKENAYIIMPLFLYDHSGVSLKCFPHGQHSAWDYGQVGYIYATKEDIQKEFGKQRISKKIIAKTQDILLNEVNIYSKYINGEVYYFSVEDKIGNHIDSCGGFYDYNDCKKEAESIVDYNIKEINENLSPLISLN